MKKTRFSLISSLMLLFPPLVLAAVLLCPLVLAAEASTPEIVASGDCGAEGANVMWKLDSEGTLTISGEGAAKFSVAPWQEVQNQITKAIVTDGVKSIGNSFFSGCSHLASAVLPEGLSAIPSETFSGCSSLASVYIPASVTAVGKNAFQDCHSMKCVYFGGSEEQWQQIEISGYLGNEGIRYYPTVFYHSTREETAENQSTPVISLTTVPAFNESKPVEGRAFTRDGTPFDPSAYRVTLYLQLSEGNTYWVKPYADSPTVTLNKDGTFSLPYVTGGTDEKARFLYVLLIPADYTPGSSPSVSLSAAAFEAAKTAALDCVTVTREESGGVAVSPLRRMPDLSRPRIAVTYAPAYEINHPFQGVVFTEDRSSFDPSAYRISLWLLYGNYYPKPTYAKPYADISTDGSFSIAYHTGGNDGKALTLYLMLIPADYTPSSTDGINGTLERAIDFVKVSRTAGSEAGEDGEPTEGTVTVMPYREPPESDDIAPAMPSGLLPVARDKIAVDVGFYTNGSAPGSALSADLIRRQLTAVWQFSHVVRFYSSGGELAKAYEIAHSMGFTVLGNAWLSKDKAANQVELDALIDNCNKGYCKIAIVGSETLLRGDLTAGELVEAIKYVRERLTDKTIPVTTGDSVDILIATPSVRNACNLLMPNCYPYWGGTAAEGAKAHFTADMEALQAVSGGKEILVSETGWPTAGQGKGKAVAGETEAAQYYAAVREWSLATNTQVLFFDAADEPWKVRDEGESGAHWGFMTKDFTLKDCYADLNPFRAEFSITSASGTDGGTETVSLANHTDTAAAVLFVAAVYDAGGRMASCNLVSRSLGAGESVSLPVPSGVQEGGTTLKAFVLDGNTLKPLRSAWWK